MKPTPRDIGPIIKRLYGARDELRKAFPELPFPLDGKLVGDIGEAIAIADFGLEKLPEGTVRHDFKTAGGKLVQVKTTQQTEKNKPVGLGLTKESFDHLVVIQIFEDGTYSVLFDGPGTHVDDARSHRTSASLTVSQLKWLNAEVDPKQKIVS
jgi:uncharacterized protein DUF6998